MPGSSRARRYGNRQVPEDPPQSHRQPEGRGDSSASQTRRACDRRRVHRIGRHRAHSVPVDPQQARRGLAVRSCRAGLLPPLLACCGLATAITSTGYFGGCVSWPTCGWRDEVAVCDASSTNSCRSPSTGRRGGVLRRDLRSVNALEECCWRCLARGESQGNVPELAHKPSRTLPSPIVYLLSLNTSPTWELLGYWCECNNCVISALRNTPIFCSFL